MRRLGLVHTRCSYTIYRHVDAHVISHLYYIQNKKTPLHRAAEKGHTTVAQLLLQAGVDTDVKDKVSTY
jgi:hypothetical protein